MTAESFETADEDSETGRIEKVHTGHVGDDVHGTIGGEVQYALTEHRRGVHVDLSGDPQDGAVAARPYGLKMKIWHSGLASACH